MGVSSGAAVLIFAIMFGGGLVSWLLKQGLEWLQKRFNLIDKDKE